MMLLAILTLGATYAVAAPAAETGPRTSPQLLAFAVQQPEALVDLVVQKVATDQSVEARIARLGGTVLAELPMINGLTVRLMASAIPQLAADNGVRWISLDSPLVKQNVDGLGPVNTTQLATVFNQTIGATDLWNRTAPLRGTGIGVAVLDSGMAPQQDLYTPMGRNRMVAEVSFSPGWNQSGSDLFGHGQHISGLIGGNGSRSNGQFVGVAPNVNIINVKVSDDLNTGTATTISMLLGMQWIFDNRDRFNIRVVNISMTDSVIESYHVSPLAAAAERLWKHGIVVVAAAGNGGAGSLAAPGNSPFVITVGAVNDRGTVSTADDQIPSWSSRGNTVDGYSKPDLVAPGVNLIAPMPTPNTFLAQHYPGNIINGQSGEMYFRMSGTSMAAPVVAGAVALLLQSEPNLTPDQVKLRLMRTATAMPGVSGAGAGIVNIRRAVETRSITGSANIGVPASAVLGNLTSTVDSTAKWSTAKWSTMQP